MTNPANVLAPANEKNVGAPIDLLCATFEAAAVSGERLEVNVGSDRDQEVDVFRIWSSRTNRSEHTHAQNAMNLRCRSREVQARSE
jgi:hypothetical protein